MKKREKQLLERIKKMEELNEIKNRQMKEIERLKKELTRTGDSKPTVKSTSRSLRPGCPRSKSSHLIRQSPRHPIEIMGSTTPDSSGSYNQRSSRQKKTQPRHRTQSNNRSKSRHREPKLIKSKSTIDETSLRSRQPTDKLPPLPSKQPIRTLSPILKKPSPAKTNNNFLLTLDQLDRLANSNATKPVTTKKENNNKYTSFAYSEDSMFVGQTKPVKIQPGGFRDKTNKLKILNSFKMPVSASQLDVRKVCAEKCTRKVKENLKTAKEIGKKQLKWFTPSLVDEWATLSDEERLNMDGVEVDLSAEDNGPSLGDDFSDSLTELRFGDKFNSDDTNSVSDSFEEPGLDYGVEISGESIVLCSYND